MIENDSHTPESVDRFLNENMIKLCSETVEYLYTAYTPVEVYYEKRSRLKLDYLVEDIISKASSKRRNYCGNHKMHDLREEECDLNQAKKDGVVFEFGLLSNKCYLGCQHGEWLGDWRELD